MTPEQKLQAILNSHLKGFTRSELLNLLDSIGLDKGSHYWEGMPLTELVDYIEECWSQASEEEQQDWINF